MSPAEGETRMAAGGSAELTFRLRSLAGEEKVRPSFADFDLDVDGNPVASKSISRSCASWGTLDQNELVLPSRGQTQLRVRLAAPDQAEGTYWCLLRLAAEGSPSQKLRGNVVQVLPMLSVPILIDVGGSSPAQVSARFEQTQRRGTQIVSSIFLEGSSAFAAHVTGRVAVEEVSAGGPVETDRKVIPRFLLLPGHRRRIPLRLTCASEAPTRLRGLLEYGVPPQTRLEIESPVTR